VDGGDEMDAAEPAGIKSGKMDRITKKDVILLLLFTSIIS
jgi:hypothetical protein